MPIRLELLDVLLVEHHQRVGRDIAFAPRKGEVFVVHPFPEVLDALYVVAFHGWHGVGTHQRELEQRQQAHLLVAAVVARDAVEAAAREFAVERQQAIETLRRVGIDRVGAVAQAGAVLRNLLLGRVAVFLRALRVAQQFAQTGRGKYRRWRNRGRA